MRATFTKNRLEAFSDGVIAIIITIMVLELKVPHAVHEGEGAGHQTGALLADLQPLIPVFLSYFLSFVYVAIYWNNHHHMLHATHNVTGGVLWANSHLLFWLSLIPFVTGWMGANGFAPATLAVYGVVLLMCALAYWILQTCILRVHGNESALARAVGKDFKGKLSLVLYVAAIGLAFVPSWGAGISGALYVAVAFMWLVPDRRIERAIASERSVE